MLQKRRIPRERVHIDDNWSLDNNVSMYLCGLLSHLDIDRFDYRGTTITNLTIRVSSAPSLYIVFIWRIIFWPSSFHTDMCCLTDNVHDYHFISQGKTTIPNVDDGEELQLTDVRTCTWWRCRRVSPAPFLVASIIFLFSSFTLSCSFFFFVSPCFFFFFSFLRYGVVPNYIH